MLGQLVHKIAFSIVQFVAPSFGESEGRSFYEKNRNIEAGFRPGLITDQRMLSEMTYGDTDVGNTGCEAVALYNALMLKRRPKPLTDIIHDLQESQTLINRGRWGTNPYKMKQIMDEYGLIYETIESIEEAETKIRSGEMLLVTVWNHWKKPLRGIHGYLILMRGESDFYMFNRNYRKKPEHANSLKEAIGDGRYIVGYLIR